MEWAGEGWREWIRGSGYSEATSTSITGTKTRSSTERKLIHCSGESGRSPSTGWPVTACVHGEGGAPGGALDIAARLAAFQSDSTGSGEGGESEGC